METGLPERVGEFANWTKLPSLPERVGEIANLTKISGLPERVREIVNWTKTESKRTRATIDVVFFYQTFSYLLLLTIINSTYTPQVRNYPIRHVPYKAYALSLESHFMFYIVRCTPTCRLWGLFILIYLVCVVRFWVR